MTPRFLESLFTSGAFLKWLLDFLEIYSPLTHLWSLVEVAARFLESLFTSGAFLKWLLDFRKVYLWAFLKWLLVFWKFSPLGPS